MKLLFLIFLFNITTYVLAQRSPELLTNYTKYPPVIMDSAILAPPSVILPKRSILVDGIRYEVGLGYGKSMPPGIYIDTSRVITFICTNDPKFAIGGLKIGSLYGSIDKGKRKKLRRFPGWGYFIEIKDDWAAAFDYKKMPADEDKILFFFKSTNIKR